MLRRKLIWGLALLTAASFSTSCGNSTSTTTSTDTGGLFIFIGDSPLCDVLSFRTAVAGMALVPQSGGANVSAIGGTAQPFIKINFAELRDLTSILHGGPVPVGTYSQVKLLFGPTQFTFFDLTRNPPVNTVLSRFSSTSQTFDIQPPLTVTKGGISGLRMDFDVRQSIGADAQGQLNGDAPAVVRFTSIAPNSSDGFGRLQDLRGFVLSVTNSSALSQFIGTLNVQILSGTADVPVVSVGITPDTQFYGEPGLNQLPGGSFVEVDGYVDSKGNLVANSVEVEDQENTSQSRVGLIGYINSITKDATGKATQFGLYVADEQPEFQSIVALDSFVQVDVSSTTKFQYSSRAVNFASLPFDATSLQVGQEVIVHGPTAKAQGGASIVAANSVYLNLQTHEGNFSSAVQVGSDDRTGAFWLKTCAQIFQGLPILMVTNQDTKFVNVTGLSGLAPQPTLIVKGLLFYELQGVTVNGVAVPPGTLVMVADQVHQIP
jgi:Domain of unknown function (DUF4382)/Domain of unknown function (DUF5666)